MGFVEVLTIVLVILKALGLIAWSWWAVFALQIFAVAIYVIILIVWVVFLFIGINKFK